MNRLYAVALVLFLCLPGEPGAAQTATEGHRVVTRTRLQVIFSAMENQWLKAVQQKDTSTLDKLLAETFEVWAPVQGEPIPLEDWTRTAFSHAPQSFEIRHLSVRSVREDTSVVSFVLSQTFSDGGKARIEDQFVVDVWVKEGESWHCTDRYASTVSIAGTPARDTKPDGKR